jgi:UDP-glucose 4-epimerase
VNVGGTYPEARAACAAVVRETIWVTATPGLEPHEDTPLVLLPHLYTQSSPGDVRRHNTPRARRHPRFGILRPARGRPPRRSSPGRGQGDGSATRQFVYVEDLAEGVVAALTPEAAGRVYNLVGDELVSVREIAHTVRELVADVPVEHGPDRPVDLVFGRADSARAASELGWRARTSFPDGVRRYVDWLTVTSGSPLAPAASSTAGSAALV